MSALLKALAFRWCRDYGDRTHKDFHYKGGECQNIFNLFCPNCNDGYNFAKDVIECVKKRLA